MIEDQALIAPSLDELITRLQAAKPVLAGRYGVEFIGVFGSYVRGEAGPESDLDVLVEFSTPPSLFQFVRMKNELAELLGVPVDLVMKSALKPALGAMILQEVMAV